MRAPGDRVLSAVSLTQRTHTARCHPKGFTEHQMHIVRRRDVGAEV